MCSRTSTILPASSSDIDWSTLADLGKPIVISFLSLVISLTSFLSDLGESFAIDAIGIFVLERLHADDWVQPALCDLGVLAIPLDVFLVIIINHRIFFAVKCDSDSRAGLAEGSEGSYRMIEWVIVKVDGGDLPASANVIVFICGLEFKI